MYTKRWRHLVDRVRKAGRWKRIKQILSEKGESERNTCSHRSPEWNVLSLLSVVHRASTSHRQRILFKAIAVTLPNDFPAILASSSTIHVIFGPSLPRWLFGFQFKACDSNAVWHLGSVCRIQLHFFTVIWTSTGFSLARFHSSLLEVTFDENTFRILCNHRLDKGRYPGDWFSHGSRFHSRFIFVDNMETWACVSISAQRVSDAPPISCFYLQVHRLLTYKVP